MPPEKEEVVKTIKGEVDAVAANLIVADIRVPKSKDIAVEFSLVDGTADHHLIVENTRYDETSDPFARNAGQIIINANTQLRFRVVNIAPKPSETKKQPFNLEIKLRKYEPCAAKRQSGPEIVGAASITDAEQGRGRMVVSGDVTGKGEMCGDVVDGVPTFGAGLPGLSVDGKKAIFTLHSPDTPTISFRGVQFPDHDGIGGWAPNTRFEVAFSVTDKLWSDLREGKTYPAMARVTYQQWQGVPVDSEQGSANNKMFFLTGRRIYTQPGYGRGLTGKVTVTEISKVKAKGGYRGEAQMISFRFEAEGTEGGAILEREVKTRSDGYIFEKNTGDKKRDISKISFSISGEVTIPCVTPTCSKMKPN